MNTATGKRKCAIARIRLKAGDGKLIVNGIDGKAYFGNRESLYKMLETPFEIVGKQKQFDIIANVAGGGKVSQADAIKCAAAKALTEFDPELRKALKAAGLLSRDARIKERKKYGQKKARKRFQFSKR